MNKKGLLRRALFIIYLFIFCMSLFIIVSMIVKYEKANSKIFQYTAFLFASLGFIFYFFRNVILNVVFLLLSLGVMIMEQVLFGKGVFDSPVFWLFAFLIVFFLIRFDFRKNKWK